MINKVILSGNVGNEPDAYTFDNGNSVVTFSLATTERGYTTQDGRKIEDLTYWHNIVVRRKGLTTLAEKYLHKGDKVTIVGKLTYRNWQDKEGGKHQNTEVIAEEIELSSKPQGEKGEQKSNKEPF